MNVGKEDEGKCCRYCGCEGGGDPFISFDRGPVLFFPPPPAPSFPSSSVILTLAGAGKQKVTSEIARPCIGGSSVQRSQSASPPVTIGSYVKAASSMG